MKSPRASQQTKPPTLPAFRKQSRKLGQLRNGTAAVFFRPLQQNGRQTGAFGSNNVFGKRVPNVNHRVGRQSEHSERMLKQNRGRLQKTHFAGYGYGLKKRQETQFSKQGTEPGIPVGYCRQAKSSFCQLIQSRQNVSVNSPNSGLPKFLVKKGKKSFAIRLRQKTAEAFPHHSKPFFLCMLEFRFFRHRLVELLFNPIRIQAAKSLSLSNFSVNGPHRRPRLNQRPSDVKCNGLRSNGLHSGVSLRQRANITPLPPISSAFPFLCRQFAISSQKKVALRKKWGDNCGRLCKKERWLSGLRRTPGKREYPKGYRGFESPPLRHLSIASAQHSIQFD